MSEAQDVVGHEVEAQDAGPEYEAEAESVIREIEAQLGGIDEEEENQEVKEVLAGLVPVTGASVPALPLNPSEGDKMIYLVTRRRIIERFMLLGYGPEAISKALDLPLPQVKGDIAWVKAEAATVYDVERIRMQVYGKYQQMLQEVEAREAKLDKAIDYDNEKTVRRTNPQLLRAHHAVTELKERLVFNSARMYGVPTTTIQHKASKYSEMLGSLAKVKTILPKE